MYLANLQIPQNRVVTAPLEVCSLDSRTGVAEQYREPDAWDHLRASAALFLTE